MADWYEIIDGEELQQGDFFSNCPVALPPRLSTLSDYDEQVLAQMLSNTRPTGKIYDVIVLSQSCDLVERKLEYVLVCPHTPLSQLEQAADENIRNFFRSNKRKEEIRRGYSPGYLMLASCELENFTREIQVVSFRSVFSVPFDFLTDLARARGRRLRLLPPYREHLAQAFARFFMRVGLPADIPPFK